MQEETQTTEPSGEKAMRLAEVIATLALANDLATGQPLEHGLRRTLLAIWLGQEMGIADEDLSTTYYVALLGTVACILDGAAFAAYVRDEIALREEMVKLDPTNQLGVATFFVKQAGAGDLPLQRLQKLISLSRQSKEVCRDVALHVGSLLDLDPVIAEALGQCDEVWNGRGSILGLSGEQIHIAARLFRVSHDAEIFDRLGGSDAALSIIRRRAGRAYDPQIAATFGRIGTRLLAHLRSQSPWDAVMEGEPTPVRTLSSPEFDEVARRVANFVDMRSNYTIGHSPGVADLARAIARELHLPADEVRTLHQTGLLHDLGRAGVPVTLWHKKGQLTPAEWDRMKRHPALSELILARSNALGHMGGIAGLHHERLDGSGYRQVSAASLPVAARVLAAADYYRSRLEPRPHRAAQTPEDASSQLSREAAAGHLDADVVTALLRAVGQERPVFHRPQQAPLFGLTEREVEVLRLVVRGLSNRQIADALIVSPKTAGHHIEAIYAKLDVSTRVGATIFAVRHGLVDDVSLS